MISARTGLRGRRLVGASAVASTSKCCASALDPEMLGGELHEFVELADWFGFRAPHDPVVVDSLPTPAFRVKNRHHVSFSTNNYLGITTSPRMKDCRHSRHRSLWRRQHRFAAARGQSRALR